MNLARKRVNRLLWVWCAAFFAAAAFTNSSLTRSGIRNGYIADLGGKGTPSSAALAHAAGEFRIVIANIMWMSVVDHYHHQFMAQGGDWSRNKDILPIINVIVTLDPHFTDAYGVGSMILCQLGRYSEATSLLHQAVKNNPTDWSMAYDEAMLYAWYRKDPKSALPYALQARSLAKDDHDRHRVDLFCRTLRDAIKNTPTAEK